MKAAAHGRKSLASWAEEALLAQFYDENLLD